jgi:hypothetical protein
MAHPTVRRCTESGSAGADQVPAIRLLGAAILPRNTGPSASPGPLAPEATSGTVRPSIVVATVAAKRSASTSSSQAARTLEPDSAADLQGVKPEQALALVGMGLMQKMAANGELPWVWNAAEDGGRCDVAALRQRLELTDLALRTGAPLSTAEITYLLGARPGSETVERGGLRARRVSRNVWKLSQAGGSSASRDTVSFASFNDGRRRFA